MIFLAYLYLWQPLLIIFIMSFLTVVEILKLLSWFFQALFKDLLCFLCFQILNVGNFDNIRLSSKRLFGIFTVINFFFWYFTIKVYFGCCSFSGFSEVCNQSCFPFHIIKMSSMSCRQTTEMLLINGHIYLLLNAATKIFALADTEIVANAHPLI